MLGTRLQLRLPLRACSCIYLCVPAAAVTTQCLQLRLPLSACSCINQCVSAPPLQFYMAPRLTSRQSTADDRFCATALLLQFFMAPSLTTGKGELKMGRGFSQFRYRTIGQPLAVLELR